MVMKYDRYRYIYPPRPKNAVDPKEINLWDDGTLLCQPKLNGSNCVIFTDGVTYKIMGRHNQVLTNFNLNINEISNIYSGKGWMAINAEYLNKSKLDENNKIFNHKLIIFDILAYNGEYLVGKTFQERVDILNQLYGQNLSDKSYLYSITENIFHVKSYNTNFKQIFDELIKIDVVEGIVCKRKNSKLELGVTSENNTKGQIKFRKPTKNYRY